ncbi:MAG: hypothetical protein AB8H47_24135 [Bacteroidia bacterium]
MILFPKHIYFLLFSIGLLSACQTWRYQRLARLPDTIAEASGLYLSAPDTCWWLNDSGGKPSIYATSLEGELLDSISIPGSQNVDWEELTSDKQGYLYLCDIGNNLNARQDLLIYKWKAGMKAAEKIRFRYPDQKAFPPLAAQQNFDAEACFWYADSLYIFSKNRSGDGNYFTKLYALPDQAGEYVAVLKDSLSLQDRVVTAAAINPQGDEITLITYDYRRDKFWPLKSSLFILSDFEERDFLGGTLYRQEIPPTRLGRQYEAVDYQQDGVLILASEGSPVTPPFIARLKMRRHK